MDRPSALGIWRFALALAVPWMVAAAVLLLLRAERAARPALAASVLPAAAQSATPNIRFNRDILPILSDNCFACHGPDSAARQAGLRLDQRGPAIAPHPSGRTAIVPGDPDASEIIRRIIAENPSRRMPPEDTGKTLAPDQIELLQTWIAQGAPWEDHWAFIPPKPAAPPTVREPTGNPIDTFIRARLESEGLDPSPPADRAVLLRRAALDLTGLPPTPDEAAAFLADNEPGAYERLVDRLLASPAYGEHMARSWLDAARYGDTHGLHLDNHREIWPYRDWVIDAFNQNKPFDTFLIEQLAGDLLPEPAQSQLIATGFNRNHVTTAEGGAIDDEYLMKYAADRVETTATVFMGLTVGCAQCHDHKFDPISQKEYYELFAFFNSVDSPAMDGNVKDHPPVVRVPIESEKILLADLRARIDSIESTLDAPDPAVDAAQNRWRAAATDAWRSGWRVLEPTEAVSTGGAKLTILEDHSILATGDNPAKDTHEITARIDRTGLRMLRLEALTHDDLPHTGPGRAENANFVLSEIEAEIVSLADPAQSRTLDLVAAAADHEQMNGPFPIASAIDGVIDDTNGWAVEGFNRRENRTAVLVAADPFGYEGGSELRVRLRFQTHFPNHAIGRTRLAVSADDSLYETIAPSGYSPWLAAGPFPAASGREAFDTAYGPEQSLEAIDPDAAFGEDNAIKWTQRTDFADGVINTLDGENCATYVARTIHAPTPRKITLNLGSDDATKVWLNGRSVHENFVARAAALDQDAVEVDLREGENVLVMKIVNLAGGYGFAFRASGDTAGGDLLRNIPLILASDLDPEQETTLRRYFRANHSPAMRELADELARVRAQLTETESALPTTLVMKELDEPRATHILFRGEYDQPREQVSPDVPDCLPPLHESYPRNRLGLALWLTEPENPLTARVTVNRLWQNIFGTGLVKTSEDFGAQGARPSHPELLDFLAAEFVRSGWDTKHMLRLMLTSETYRQDSAVTPELLDRDPENRLLARGPRHRLDAEVIRDQALAASGLLVERIGGPSVRPYQPEGLWEAVAYPDSDTREFTPGEGDEHFRRSMYTYWKRTSPPPNLAAFDAPSREYCIVRRARTTTPLQALVLLNDPQFVEFARATAQRAWLTQLSELSGPHDHTIDAALTRAFRLLLVRTPTDDERAILRDLYESQLDRYRNDPDAARQLLAVGASPRDESIDPAAHAALTNVCAAIMNLDEAITKN